MIYAMSGGLWLHRHIWAGHPMAHLISSSRGLLVAYGRKAGLNRERLEYKALRDPRDRVRRDAWHWDLVGPWLPPQG
ncbi:MAG TPA: hypothetical protein VF368_03890 [Gemmatimonadaceae bacterium]|jgi:hypothetical protein